MIRLPFLQLAQEIADGKRLTSNDDLERFIDCDLQTLREGADWLRKRFVGDRVDLCAIVNAKRGRCPENCKYCAQSTANRSRCKEYGLLPTEALLRSYQVNDHENVARFSLVTSGRALVGDEFERALEAYRLMRKSGRASLCASMGFLSEDQLLRLRGAGVTTYHHNIETSPRYFSHVCTTHSIEQKLATLKLVKKVGLRLCSGGIIGMGETWRDRIDMALLLAEHAADSIPINVLIPIPNTPFQDMPRISEIDILRTIAIFRYINPTADIRLAAGRAQTSDCGLQALCSGANALITGNMLTSASRATPQTDRIMLQSLGRTY